METYFRVFELLAEFAHALDEGRHDDWVDLFSSDAELTQPGHPPIVGREQLHRYARERKFADRVHLLGNVLVEPQGSDRLSVRSTFMVAESNETLNGSVVAAGTYHYTIIMVDDKAIIDGVRVTRAF